MSNVVVFPRPHIQRLKGVPRCVGCGKVAAASGYRTLELSGDHAGQRKDALMCDDCYNDTPAWVWVAK